jgi:hypothetical protein
VIRRHQLIASGCLSLIASAASAIQSPSAPPPQKPPEAPAVINVQPADETALYTTIWRVTLKDTFRETPITDDVMQRLQADEIDTAVELLNKLADKGDENANLALVRLQKLCSAMSSLAGNANAEAMAKMVAQLPSERAARVLGMTQAQVARAKVVRDRCQRADFNFNVVGERLQRAAAAGKAASQFEASRYTNDPKQRMALLDSAVAQHYIPAMYALGAERLYAVQRGDSTENVSSIRALLKQAARDYPTAKVSLANCMALGCDGHPAEPANAAVFGVDAAKDGEPTVYVSMARMPWGVQLTREQLLGWQYFGDRLNEAGCLGQLYPTLVVQFVDIIGQLEKNQKPDVLKHGHELGDQYWTDFSARAKRQQGCE